MSNFGRGGPGYNDWYNSQRSEFLREYYKRESHHQKQWFMSQADNASLSSTMSSTGQTIMNTLNTPRAAFGDQSADSVKITPEMLEESACGAWTASRGAFRDPTDFKSKLDRSAFRQRTERGEYHEDCIKRKSMLGNM